MRYRVVSSSTDCGKAVRSFSYRYMKILLILFFFVSQLYEHGKILVAALNGPVMGMLIFSICGESH